MQAPTIITSSKKSCIPSISLQSILHYRELTWNLVARNLKVRYKNSTLGFFWTLLTPLSSILIWYFFIRLARFQMDLAELLSGLIAWHFLSMTLGDSIESISGNATLITKVRFPRIILPLSTLLANSLNFLLSLAVLIVCLPLLGHFPTLSLVWLIPGMLLISIFIFGVVLIIATANVYFKDTSHILSIILQAWFFMTPIIYPLSIIPVEYRDVLFLNPMALIVSIFRMAFLGQSFVWTPFHFSALLLIFVTLVIGFMVFSRSEPYFADEL